MKNKKGFTLIEVLVVVLIIGILAAIALPQYRFAVQKAKSTEAIQNLAYMKKEISEYFMRRQTSRPEGVQNCKSQGIAELSGGHWSGEFYTTENFDYLCLAGNELINAYVDASVLPNYDYVVSCTLEGTIYNNDTRMGDGWYCYCITEQTDLGRKVCKKIYEPLGFKYVDIIH